MQAFDESDFSNTMLLLLVGAIIAWRPPPHMTLMPGRPALAVMMYDEAAPPKSETAQGLYTKPPVISSLLKMARLKTIPMSAALVVSGAYGARHAMSTPAVSAGDGYQLALCTLLTMIVTCGSMLINE